MTTIDFDRLVNAVVVETFGEAASYLPTVSRPGTPAISVAGVFDYEHTIVMEEIAGSETNAAGVSTLSPTFALRASALSFAPRQGDEITIRGVRYRIWDVHPEFDAFYTLILKKKV